MITFTERSPEKEIMDQRVLNPAETASVYTWIARVNKYLGGTSVILKYLEKWSENWPADKTIRILDVGTGGSDIPAAIAQWAQRKDKMVKVTALDIDLEALRFGKIKNADPSLFWVQASCEDMPFADGAFDYVISSMFFHHLPDAMIYKCLRFFDAAASRGIIINDLLRSPLAYAGFWLLTRFIPDPIFRHDGLLSILRAFRMPDLKTMVEETGLDYLTGRNHFAFRIALAGEKNA